VNSISCRPDFYGSGAAHELLKIVFLEGDGVASSHDRGCVKNTILAARVILDYACLDVEHGDHRVRDYCPDWSVTVPRMSPEFVLCAKHAPLPEKIRRRDRIQRIESLMNCLPFFM
jgi:hypothetical protein